MRAYDAVAWRYGRSQADLNFTDMHCHTEEMDEVPMVKFVKANPHLVAAELQFYTNREKEQRKKENAKMDKKIFDKVERMFEELEEEGYYDSEEEDVEPYIGNDGEAGPSRTNAGNLDSDDDSFDFDSADD